MSSANTRCCTFVLLAAMSIVAAVDAGAATDVRFRKLSTDEGLSHDVVYAIVQDQIGFLWIGTEADGRFRCQPATREITRIPSTPGGTP